MKIIALLCVVALVGCTPDLEDAVHKAAASGCSGASILYETFVASDYGSDRDKATVDAAYKPISELCADPATITAAQLLIVTAQTAAIIKIVRKTKTDG